MQRRLSGLGAMVLAAALVLTGCGTGSAASRPVTLELVAADYGSGAQDSSARYWKDLAAAFTELNPGIEVHVTVFSWNTIDAKVAAMIKRGEVPDILQTGSYADFAADDMLYSADELLSIPVQADFITSLARAGEVQRVQYGLPFVSSSRMFFYNADLFARAGISAPPKTWDDVERDAVKLKASGVELPFGLPLGPEEAQAESMMWMLGNGGGFTDRIGTYSIDSEDNVATFRWLKDHLVDRGLAGPAPARTDRQKVFDAFVRGKVGMLNGHPTLRTQADKARLNYGVVRIPGKEGPLSDTLGVADWMMAFKKNGHRDQIGKFLEFAYSERNALAFLEQYNLLPVTVSASDAMRADKSYKDLWPFLDNLPTARFYPLGDPAWAPISAEVKKRIGNAVTGDPRRVLEGLQRTASEATSAEQD